MESLDVKDSLVADACSAQLSNGVMPTPRVAEEYMRGILERLNNKQAAKPAKDTSPSVERGPGPDREFKRRTGREMKGRIDRNPKPIVSAKTIASIATDRLRVRMRLLRTKEDWKTKLEAIAGPMILANPAQRHVLAGKLFELLERSNKTFGDWRKDNTPPKRLIFG